MGWFPNPISWVLDKAGGLLSDAASNVIGWSFDKVIAGLVAWVLDGVAWAVGAIFGFISASTSPNVTSTWFVGDTSHDGPYRVMVGVAALLLLVFVFAGIIQGVLAGDTGGMLRRIGVDLPFAIGGMLGLVVFTQTLIDLTDQLSAGILASFGDDVRHFMDNVAQVGQLTGGVATALVIFLLGLGTLLAALVIFVELVIRSALIYVVVGLCPLAFAALLWPVTRGVLRRILELLAALILSKVVIALALAIGAAALGGAGQTSTSTSPLVAPGASAAPAATAGSDAATVTSAAGVLLAGLATFAVACFSPFVVLRLFPAVESAVVAQGLRGGPLRAGQQAAMVSSRVDAGRRYGTAAAGGTTGASSSGAAAAGSGPAAAVAVGAQVAAAGQQRVARAATQQTGAARTDRTTDRRPPAPPSDRPPSPERRDG
jgi:type IV secretion system protein TrbL